jgi:hypothetical protein
MKLVSVAWASTLCGVSVACVAQAPQTLADVLPGGEWICVEASESSASGTTRFAWKRDGTWTQNSTVQFQDNADTVSLEAVVSGGYRIEGNAVSMKGEHADIQKVTRNGVVQTISETEETRIERGILLVYDGDWQQVPRWDFHAVVWKDGNKEVSCTR